MFTDEDFTDQIYSSVNPSVINLPTDFSCLPTEKSVGNSRISCSDTSSCPYSGYRPLGVSVPLDTAELIKGVPPPHGWQGDITLPETLVGTCSGGGPCSGRPVGWTRSPSPGSLWNLQKAPDLSCPGFKCCLLGYCARCATSLSATSHT